MSSYTSKLVFGLALSLAAACVWGCASKSASSSSGTSTSVVGQADDLQKKENPEEYEYAPTPINMPIPHYPEEARKAGVEGVVYVKLLVDNTGVVRAALVSENSGTHVGFEEEAIKAAKKSTWKPATKSGKPITVWVNYPIKFTLK